MAASSTWTQPSLSNVCCVSARCTGFAKVRGKNDFAFVVETEWSDQRKQCVKRTFDEFQILHGCLIKAFPDVKNAERKLLNLRSGIKDLFTQDRRRLAEIREPVIDAYLRGLTMLPEKISRSSLVLTFLEPRDTDPKPVRALSGCSRADDDPSPVRTDTAGIELTGDRTKCHGWPDEQQQQPANSWKAYRDWCVATVLKSLQQPDSARGNIALAPVAHGAGKESAAGTTAQPVEVGSAGDDGSQPTADADENYFLNVGVQELMLLDSDELASAQLDSMWCSDFEKFSEILRHNIGAFPLAVDQRRRQKATEPIPGLSTAGDMTESSYQQCDDDGADECSDTESQLMERSYYVDNDIDGSELESDDEFAACGLRPGANGTDPPHVSAAGGLD